MPHEGLNIPHLDEFIRLNEALLRLIESLLRMKARYERRLATKTGYLFEGERLRRKIAWVEEMIDKVTDKLERLPQIRESRPGPWQFTIRAKFGKDSMN